MSGALAESLNSPAGTRLAKTVFSLWAVRRINKTITGEQNRGRNQQQDPNVDPYEARQDEIRRGDSRMARSLQRSMTVGEWLEIAADIAGAGHELRDIEELWESLNPEEQAEIKAATQEFTIVFNHNWRERRLEHGNESGGDSSTEATTA